MNPLGNAIPAVNPMLQNLAETIRFAKTFQSPSAFMSEMQKHNPQMVQYLSQLSQMLKNPSLAAQQILAQQGITPDQIQGLLAL